MADVYTYIDNTGLILTDASTIQAEVVQEYVNAFGTDLVTPDVNNLSGSSTPQGLLINAEALARIAVADNNAALANQINPNVSGGVHLDALMSLTGSQRIQETQTAVTARVTGVVGTAIPSGSLASETGSGNNYNFAITTPDSSPVIIGPDGFTDGVVFLSVLFGPIPCAPGTLTTIISNVIGWETIVGSSEPILGQDTQSDNSARQSRLVQLAGQGASTAGSIIAAVSKVVGTQGSVGFLENTASTTETIGGVSMVSHSIYVSISSPVININGTQSTVTAILTGTPAAVIPAGTLVSETFSGYDYVFSLIDNATIGGGGTVSANFNSVIYGQVPAVAGSLTTIVVPVSGLASVTNPLSATLGLPSPVAYAITSKKSAGAAYNNGPGTHIQALVVVPYSNQNIIVLYDTATPVPIWITISIKVITPVQSPTTSVQNAIINYVNGNLSGIDGWVVGQNVSSFEISGAVTAQLPGIYVQNCLISTSAVPTSPDEIAITAYQIATINPTAIVVTVL